MTIEQINRIVESTLNGSTSLHVAEYYDHNEIVKLLLQHGASRLIQLFRRINDGDRFCGDLKNTDVLEWLLSSQEPILSRSQFRHELTQIPQSSTIQDKFIKIRTTYIPSLNELSSKHKTIIDHFFLSGIAENNLIYFLKAYASLTNFYLILNKHLAIYSLEYFDPLLRKSIDYALLKCIMDIISILLIAPEFEQYTYRDNCYRGEGHSEALRRTPDKTLIQFSTICTYTVKNNRTAFDSERESEVLDEAEIFILPFSMFTVRNIKRRDSMINNGIAVELELEECEDQELKDNLLIKRPLIKHN
ncbi:unnamed protein product [Rotaria sp. Silwood2]|nr:unnamed protein product [Rotaria sp. Silwood2]CAF3950359.1 unnamed protein product [Rotaria sp. Silwood2]